MCVLFVTGCGNEKFVLFETGCGMDMFVSLGSRTSIFFLLCIM
jgi:hypothetical protein